MAKSNGLLLLRICGISAEMQELQRAALTGKRIYLSVFNVMQCRLPDKGRTGIVVYETEQQKKPRKKAGMVKYINQIKFLHNVHRFYKSSSLKRENECEPFPMCADGNN